MSKNPQDILVRLRFTSAMSSTQLVFAAERATSNHLFPFLITHAPGASVHIYTATTKQQSSRTRVYSIENHIRPCWSGQTFVIWASPPSSPDHGSRRRLDARCGGCVFRRCSSCHSNIRPIGVSQSTDSIRLRCFRLARLDFAAGLCGSKLGFTSGLARMTKTASLTLPLVVLSSESANHNEPRASVIPKSTQGEEPQA